MARIHAEIARDGPMHVRPVHGPRAVRPGRRLLPGGRRRGPGATGDFLTAPEAHPIFGAALSRGGRRRLGSARPAGAVSCSASTGPGPARSAVAILDGLRRERPGPRRRHPATSRSRSKPARLDALADRLARPATACADPRSTTSTAPDDPIDGRHPRQRGARRAADAPARRPRGRHLREVFVGSEDGAFVDVEAEPSTPALAARLDAEGVALADGQRAEVCLAARWLGRGGRPPVSARGVALLIDYGYPAARAVRPRPPARRDAPRVPPPPGPRRSVRPRRPPGPDRPRRRDRGGAGRRRGRPRPPRDDDPGRVPGRARDGGAAPGDPGRSGDDARGATSPSARRSCACSTRARWAASGSWPSGAAGPATDRPCAGSATASRADRRADRTAADRTGRHRTRTGIRRCTYCRP